MIFNDWIIEFRTDYFTNFFKYFPLLASDYFYVSVIALGYWLNPNSRIFKSLGFLVPFSTLLNCILKNFFQIPCPDFALHLVKVYDPFGFPSGDVQVAAIFWVSILMSLQIRVFKYLCLIPIIGISVSRIYLGVHSIYDVIGALIIASIILLIWIKYLETKMLKNTSSVNKDYWFLLILTIIAYIYVSRDMQIPPMVPISIGALIGFGASLKWMNDLQETQGKMNILSAVLYLLMIIGFAFIFPLIRNSQLFFPIMLILKFALIVLSIFYFVPKFHSKVLTKIKI